MSATHNVQVTTDAAVLHMSIELSYKSWKLGFAVGLGHSPRIRTIVGGDYDALVHEIRLAKVRFKLPQGAPVHPATRLAPTHSIPTAVCLSSGSKTSWSIPRASRRAAAGSAQRAIASTPASWPRCSSVGTWATRRPGVW